MRNNLKWWTGSIILFLAIFVFAYSNFAENKQGSLTQGEVAQMLGEKINLEMPEGAGTSDYISALEQYGIKPADGWKADKPVTSEDMGNILVGAGRLQAEVDAGKDPKAALKEVGVVLPSEINKASLNKMLEEPSVKRLLEAPLMTTETTVPYPVLLNEENEEINAPQGTKKTEEKPLAPTPPPPKDPQDVRPSGGGGS